jgi:hypothetical protein
MGQILIPASAQRDVQRGRDAARQLSEMVQEARDRGLTVHEVRISNRVANAMRAFFAVAFAEFDNVLPPRVLGVPLFEGGCERDVEIKTTRPGREL